MTNEKSSPIVFLFNSINKDASLTRKQKNDKILELLEAGSEEIKSLKTEVAEGENFLRSIANMVVPDGQPFPSNSAKHREITISNLKKRISNKQQYDKNLFVQMDKLLFNHIMYLLHRLAEHPFNEINNMSPDNLIPLMDRAIKIYNKNRNSNYDSQLGQFFLNDLVRSLGIVDQVQHYSQADQCRAVMFMLNEQKRINKDVENLTIKVSEKVLIDQLLKMVKSWNNNQYDPMGKTSVEQLDEILTQFASVFNDANFTKIYELLSEILNIKSSNEKPSLEDFKDLIEPLTEFNKNFKGMKELFKFK